MILYCLKCKINTESENLRIVKTKKHKNNAFNHAVYGSKKSRFIIEQKAKRLVSVIGKIPLLIIVRNYVYLIIYC